MVIVFRKNVWNVWEDNKAGAKILDRSLITHYSSLITHYLSPNDIMIYYAADETNNYRLPRLHVQRACTDAAFYCLMILRLFP